MRIFESSDFDRQPKQAHRLLTTKYIHEVKGEATSAILSSPSFKKTKECLEDILRGELDEYYSRNGYGVSCFFWGGVLRSKQDSSFAREVSTKGLFADAVNECTSGVYGKAMEDFLNFVCLAEQGGGYFIEWFNSYEEAYDAMQERIG